jgi:hypothetical protein
MLATFFLLAALPTFCTDDEARAQDAKSLVEVIESLQQSVEDFRCEFEGTIQFKGKIAEYEKVGQDGLYESYSGIFIWKRGGDTHCEALHRRAFDNEISRESLVVRTRERRAEYYQRLNDAPLGYAVVQKPEEIRLQQKGFAKIFLIDDLKLTVADASRRCWVSDDELQGRSFKVLNVPLRGVPDLLIGRDWIDLRRNGHVVHQESYTSGKAVSGRLDIALAPFKVGSTEVWMPVAGESVGYMALVEKKPVVLKEPQSIEKMYVVCGTMEFNKHPGPEVFTIEYRPGTPVSDKLRKLEYEFGQQKIGLKPTKAEAEKMLNEQVAEAEAQKNELAVASASQGSDWTSWLALGSGTLALISLAVLWIQRRRR